MHQRVIYFNEMVFFNIYILQITTLKISVLKLAPIRKV